MNKENLRAVIFASLKLFGLNIKPFCILNNAYDTLYLPDQNMIIPVDLADDKERRSRIIQLHRIIRQPKIT